MRSNYKKLGDFISKVDVRNKNLQTENLQGLSMTKEFRKSTSNIVGTNLKKYKIVGKNQFACDFMSVIRVHKLPVVLHSSDDLIIVSPAYTVFKIIDETVLNPEYLMMWFRRPEFDRYADFRCDSAIRGGFKWDELCETELPVPSIEKQHEIVKEYNVVKNRISLNVQLNQKLEETAQALYKHWFVKQSSMGMLRKTLGELCSLITDGKHGNCTDEESSGYYFLSAKDIRNNTLVYSGARQINREEFEETHRRTDLKPKDICMINTGATIGRMSLVPNNDKTYKTTFQKSVAVLKPKKQVSEGYFLFCLLKNAMREIIELGKGTSQHNLLLGDLKDFEVDYPGYEMVEKFEKIISPIFLTYQSKMKQNELLSSMKNLVLSKLATVKEEKEMV